MGKSLIKTLLKFYQKALSPFLGPHCRYYPSCSHYSLSALERFDFFRAMGITLVRLSKCHPFSRGGFDPVPQVVLKKKASQL